jgi:hypothetical protein
LAFIELKMRVNSPGPELGAGAAGAFGGGALGGGAAVKGAFEDGALEEDCEFGDDGASGEFIDRNICVKLPPSPFPAAGAGAGAAAGTRSHGVSAGTAGKAGGVFSAEEILSIGTGLKTFANSWEGLANGCPPVGSGVLSACSIRVNSPCEAGGGAAAGAGTGAGSAKDAAGNDAGAAAGEGAGAGAIGGAVIGAAAGGSCGFFPSKASRSSSSREGAEEGMPKMPVALDCALSADGSVPGVWGVSGRSLNASMCGHHASKKCVVPESKTTSPWLDSKERAAYDANTLDGSDVRAGWRGGN